MPRLPEYDWRPVHERYPEGGPDPPPPGSALQPTSWAMIATKKRKEKLKVEAEKKRLAELERKHERNQENSETDSEYGRSDEDMEDSDYEPTEVFNEMKHGPNVAPVPLKLSSEDRKKMMEESCRRARENLKAMFEHKREEEAAAAEKAKGAAEDTPMGKEYASGFEITSSTTGMILGLESEKDTARDAVVEDVGWRGSVAKVEAIASDSYLSETVDAAVQDGNKEHKSKFDSEIMTINESNAEAKAEDTTIDYFESFAVAEAAAFAETNSKLDSIPAYPKATRPVLAGHNSINHTLDTTIDKLEFFATPDAETASQGSSTDSSLSLVAASTELEDEDSRVDLMVDLIMIPANVSEVENDSQSTDSPLSSMSTFTEFNFDVAKDSKLNTTLDIVLKAIDHKHNGFEVATEENKIVMYDPDFATAAELKVPSPDSSAIDSPLSSPAVSLEDIDAAFSKNFYLKTALPLTELNAEPGAVQIDDIDIALATEAEIASSQATLADLEAASSECLDAMIESNNRDTTLASAFDDYPTRLNATLTLTHAETIWIATDDAGEKLEEIAEMTTKQLNIEQLAIQGAEAEKMRLNGEIEQATAETRTLEGKATVSITVLEQLAAAEQLKMFCELTAKQFQIEAITLHDADIEKNKLEKELADAVEEGLKLESEVNSRNQELSRLEAVDQRTLDAEAAEERWLYETAIAEEKRFEEEVAIIKQCAAEAKKKKLEGAEQLRLESEAVETPKAAETSKAIEQTRLSPRLMEKKLLACEKVQKKLEKAALVAPQGPQVGVGSADEGIRSPESPAAHQLHRESDAADNPSPQESTELRHKRPSPRLAKKSRLAAKAEDARRQKLQEAADRLRPKSEATESARLQYSTSTSKRPESKSTKRKRLASEKNEAADNFRPESEAATASRKLGLATQAAQKLQETAISAEKAVQKKPTVTEEASATPPQNKFSSDSASKKSLTFEETQGLQVKRDEPRLKGAVIERQRRLEKDATADKLLVEIDAAKNQRLQEVTRKRIEQAAIGRKRLLLEEAAETDTLRLEFEAVGLEKLAEKATTEQLELTKKASEMRLRTAEAREASLRQTAPRFTTSVAERTRFHSATNTPKKPPASLKSPNTGKKPPQKSALPTKHTFSALAAAAVDKHKLDLAVAHPELEVLPEKAASLDDLFEQTTESKVPAERVLRGYGEKRRRVEAEAITPRKQAFIKVATRKQYLGKQNPGKPNQNVDDEQDEAELQMIRKRGFDAQKILSKSKKPATAPAFTTKTQFSRTGEKSDSTIYTTPESVFEVAGLMESLESEQLQTTTSMLSPPIPQPAAKAAASPTQYFSPKSSLSSSAPSPQNPAWNTKKAKPKESSKHKPTPASGSTAKRARNSTSSLELSSIEKRTPHTVANENGIEERSVARSFKKSVQGKAHLAEKKMSAPSKKPKEKKRKRKRK